MLGETIPTIPVRVGFAQKQKLTASASTIPVRAGLPELFVVPI